MAEHEVWQWTGQADTALKMTPRERIRAWNLDCVGKANIPATAGIADEHPTFYELSSNGTTLTIRGDVEPGFYRKAVAALDASPKVDTVVLGSGGGFVSEAILTARELRRRKLTTVVRGSCHSACTLVFIGGIKRQRWSPDDVLGFHQVSVDGSAVPLDSPVYETIRQFGAEMGVDSKVLVQLMHSAPPERLHRPGFGSLCASRIATWEYHACSTDW